MPRVKKEKFSCITDHKLFKAMPVQADGRLKVWLTEYFCASCNRSWHDRTTLCEDQFCDECLKKDPAEICIRHWIGPDDGEEIWEEFQAMTRRGLCAYVVVENCGHDGEQDVRQTPSLAAAMKWKARQYGEEEAEALHVQIARIFPDGSRSYEY